MLGVHGIQRLLHTENQILYYTGFVNIAIFFKIAMITVIAEMQNGDGNGNSTQCVNGNSTNGFMNLLFFTFYIFKMYFNCSVVDSQCNPSHVGD